MSWTKPMTMGAAAFLVFMLLLYFTANAVGPVVSVDKCHCTGAFVTRIGQDGNLWVECIPDRFKPEIIGP